ncbi:MAG: hypothetical protein ACOC5T_01765 [Elusimicrobiota bacterium]
MAYSIPGDMNSTTDVFTWVGEVTSNWFFPGILIAVWIIAIIKMSFNPSNTISKSFAAASFVVMILSVFARTLDFVSTGFMTVFILMTAMGAIWMHAENQSV